MKDSQKGTVWKLFTSNEETLQAMIEACESAKETIELEQFICVLDAFGNRLIDICIRKAREGVRVRFVWDAAGSFSFFGASIVEDLRKKGVELVFFKTIFPSFFHIYKYKSWYFRNHRRSLIVDKKIGFTGSICINEQYKDWHDTNVRVEGRVVEDMSVSFERMWNRANKKRNREESPKTKYDDFTYLTNSPIPKHRKLYRHVLEAIRNAEKNICITSPYFVPTLHIARALRKAVHRGVNVKLIIPEKSDNRFPDLCARTFFYSMLKAGVKIYLYKKGMLHRKTIVIDDRWSSIGTLNMDYVALVYNFEGSVISRDRKFAEELVTQFIKDMNESEEITLEKWNGRYWKEKFAGFFLKFIRFFF